MKKNIMFILPTLCGGGAEKTVANLSLFLKDNYNIQIVVFRDTEIKYSYGGNLNILSKKENKGFIRKILFVLKSIKKLKKLKEKYKIDYAISFLTTADFLNVMSNRKNTKNYISIRNTDSIYTKNKIYKYMTYFSCKKCERIISISKQVKLDLINNFGVPESKITTIYNPSLKIEFDNKGKDFRKLDPYTFVNIGRLTDQKGQWHLIRAFNEVVKTIPQATLIILGEGELKPYLQKLINDYGLEKNIFLEGFVSNPYYYLKNSLCFVFSSLYEGLGNAILEAIACHTPVISTDCIAGPREILAPNSDFNYKTLDKVEYETFGILTPTCDGVKYSAFDKLTKEENLLKEAIITFLNNKNMQENYKRQAKIRSEDFSIDEIVKQWEKILN